MERILNYVGLGLLALCFAVALARIAIIRSGGTTDGRIEIRLAHWQLEGGIRDAIDRMANEYMQRNPGIKIVQTAIPERIYSNWLITQLVGGTPPDIIQIGLGMTNERLARFFIPLSDLAESPNPHNADNELAGVRLRETFFDGMQGGYSPGLLEYYGIPLSAHTIRLYINLDLLQKITGEEKLPRTYLELMQLADRTKAWGVANGNPVLPIAGSRYNAPILMHNLFASQTQRKVQEFSPPGSMDTGITSVAEAYIAGKWSFDDEEIRQGFGLMREVGTQMQPGFMQSGRDDAVFYFIQQRALMITTGSWDSSSIRLQAPFRFTAVRIPLPSVDDPVYGRFVLGSSSEAGTNSGLSLGVTRASPHPGVAKDFLLFLASQEINQLFTRESKWLPSVVGVTPAPEAEPFMITTEGYPQGFTPISPGQAPDTTRALMHSFHHLVGPGGSVEKFIEASRQDYEAGLVTDLNRALRSTRQSVQRMDTQFGALVELASLDPEDKAAALKVDIMATALSDQDREYYRQQRLLRRAETFNRKGDN